MLSAELALSIASRAACAALGLGFIEQFATFDRAYGPRGPYARPITDVMGSARWTRRLPDPALRGMLATGAIAGVAGTTLGPFSPAGRLALAVLLACVVITRLRRVMGSDGAEQMAVLTLFAAALAVLPAPSPFAIHAAVWFVAGQCLLSYLTAGVAKALSPIWRRGGALALIMGSEAHGQPWAATMLAYRPWLARLLTRSVILFECGFPLILVAPRGLAFALLGIGFAFHLGCAISMGLNTFLIAFPGTYACVVYLAQRTSPLW